MILCCVETGDYEGMGREYVARLRGMAKRHMPVPHRFVCLSDGVHDCETIPVDEPGWWAKLALFRPGLFPFGERVVYLDLDTVIVGSLGPLLTWNGIFGALGPFRGGGGDQIGSAVMSWRSGFGSDIWTAWVDAGKPQISGGDDHWIFGRYPQAHRLQVEVPGIYSYKFHKCREAPPKDAMLVCFANRPKPHDCGSAWVHDHWKP